jgi:cytoplasmic tRNA 2-thiolation protein 2
MRDRTDDIRDAVEQYNLFEFIPLRIESAFDAQWWNKVIGQRSPQDLVADTSSEGMHDS